MRLLILQILGEFIASLYKNVTLGCHTVLENSYCHILLCDVMNERMQLILDILDTELQSKNVHEGHMNRAMALTLRDENCN